MDTTGHRDGPEVDAVLAGLLGRHRDSGLCAIGPGGISVAMPDSVSTGGHHVVTARSPLDLVAPEDRVLVISAWERAQSTGAQQAHIVVRLTNEPDRTVSLHLLDARERHGVFLGVFVPTDDPEPNDDRFAFLGQEVSPVPPRFARVRQNEMGMFLEVDDALCRILDRSRDELIGQLSLDFIHPDDHALAIDNWMDMLAASAPISRVRLRHRHRDGSWIWMEITNYNMLEDENPCVVAEMVNVSDEMAAHEALRAREQLLQRLAEALPVGVVQVGADNQVVYTNRRLHAILGVPQEGTVDAQMASVLPEDRTGLSEAFDAVLKSGLDSDLEVRLRMSPEDDGKEMRRCIFSLRALTTKTGEVTGAIVCVADVTESARLRDELHVRATFDDITGCHNRASTMAALAALLSDTGALSRPAVIFVDLDRFKEVNDKLGHAAGDELLAIVGRRLLRAVRTEDIVGRIGGDEFLVIRPGVTTPEQAMTTARRLEKTFSQEVRLKSGRLSCQASIGVAWSSDPALEAEDLVARADTAMYEAKRTGHVGPVLYQGSVEAPAAP